MEYYIFIIITLLIIIISLAIGNYLLLNNIDKIERFQSLTQTQISNMSACNPNPNLKIDPSCTSLSYYDTSSKLQKGNFRNLPENFYLDTDNILQPVPYGNTVTLDKHGYLPIDKSEKFSNLQTNYQENAINPSICNLGDIDYNAVPKKCYDVSYIHIDANKKLQILKNKIRIPYGYYINNGIVNKIPYGYIVDPVDNTKIKITSNYESDIFSSKFNISNFNDVQYHNDPTKTTNTDDSSAGPGKMWILDNSKNLIAVPYGDVSTNILYYEPGSFRFGSSNYVPNYEETIYLSKLTNI
jgi:hypothetical protein